MTKCDVDLTVKAELKDILFDLLELNSVSMELQFLGEDLIQYRYWLLNSVTYTILAIDILEGGKKKRKIDLTEFTYSEKDELKDLTTRVCTNYSKLITAYQDEVHPGLAEILNVIRMCLTITKSHV
jgi:hypothetical protein